MSAEKFFEIVSAELRASMTRTDYPDFGLLWAWLDVLEHEAAARPLEGAFTVDELLGAGEGILGEYSSPTFEADLRREIAALSVSDTRAQSRRLLEFFDSLWDSPPERGGAHFNPPMPGPDRPPGREQVRAVAEAYGTLIREEFARWRGANDFNRAAGVHERLTLFKTLILQEWMPDRAKAAREELSTKYDQPAFNERFVELVGRATRVPQGSTGDLFDKIGELTEQMKESFRHELTLLRQTLAAGREKPAPGPAGEGAGAETGQNGRLRMAYPLAFRLRDEWDQPVLSALAPAGQEMTLHIANRAPGDIILPGVAGAEVGPGSAHFTLRFRKGVLQGMANIELEGPDPGWEKGYSLAPERWDELYIRGPAGHRIAPQEERLLTLRHVRADAGDGARNARVQFLYSDLAHQENPLAGFREQTLSIVYQRPGPLEPPARLPLVAHFDTLFPAILADGSANRLTVHLANWSGQKESLHFSQESRIRIWFDVQEPGALSTLGEAVDFQAEIAGWRAQATTQGKLERILYPEKDFDLPWGATLALTLGGLRTTLPAGPATITIAVDNVEGAKRRYPGREYTLPVVKSRLRFPQVRSARGAPEPGALLEIRRPQATAGTREVPLLAFADAGGNNLLSVGAQGYVGLGTGAEQPASPLTLTFNTDRGDQDGERGAGPAVLSVEQTGAGPALRVRKAEGQAIVLAPAAGKALSIGRDDANSLVFDSAAGQSLNSSAGLRLTLHGVGDAQGNQAIDFRRKEAGDGEGALLLRIDDRGYVGIGTGAERLTSPFSLKFSTEETAVLSVVQSGVATDKEPEVGRAAYFESNSDSVGTIFVHQKGSHYAGFFRSGSAKHATLRVIQEGDYYAGFFSSSSKTASTFLIQQDGSATALEVKGNVAVDGYIAEQLPIIKSEGRSDGWKDKGHPVYEYFHGKLEKASIGTMIKAIWDNGELDFDLWIGWKTSSGKIVYGAVQPPRV